jgi:DtxR family Mn-dependent transcriptional regulator
MIEQKLSESQQDYLKIVLALINEKKVARIKEIATRKDVSMPSATEAMRKLSNEGYIQYSAREFIKLTTTGEKAAHRLSSKYSFLKHFFSDVLNINEKLADREACAIEHHLSNSTLERLILLYQFLNECEKNDSRTINLFKEYLKAAEGGAPSSVVCQNCFIARDFPHHPGKKILHTLLTNLNRGQDGQIVMLGPDSEIRLSLIDKGLLPGSLFHVEEAGDAGSPFVIQTDGCLIELDEEVAKMIEVAIEQPK